MPATSENTLIKVYRAHEPDIPYTLPEVGEPLLNLDTYRLNVGDGRTRGGRGIRIDGGILSEIDNNAHMYITYMNNNDTILNLPFESDIVNPLLGLYIEGIKIPHTEYIMETSRTLKFINPLKGTNLLVEVIAGQIMKTEIVNLSKGASLIELPFTYNHSQPNVALFIEGIKIPYNQITYIDEQRIELKDPVTVDDLTIEAVLYYEDPGE